MKKLGQEESVVLLRIRKGGCRLWIFSKMTLARLKTGVVECDLLRGVEGGSVVCCGFYLF